MSVTSSALEFTYSGHLRDLLMYTTAKDALPLQNLPDGFIGQMGVEGVYMYTKSDAVVQNQRFSVPLSGGSVLLYGIGKIVDSMAPVSSINNYYVGNLVSGMNPFMYNA